MKLFTLIKNFHNDESGAVTVDWVVLTAAVVGLAIAVGAAIMPGLENLAGGINDAVNTGVTDSLPTGTRIPTN